MTPPSGCAGTCYQRGVRAASGLLAELPRGLRPLARRRGTLAPARRLWDLGADDGPKTCRKHVQDCTSWGHLPYGTGHLSRRSVAQPG
jgi:hypothetical protein